MLTIVHLVGNVMILQGVWLISVFVLGAGKSEGEIMRGSWGDRQARGSASRMGWYNREGPEAELKG